MASTTPAPISQAQYRAAGLAKQAAISAQQTAKTPQKPVDFQVIDHLIILRLSPLTEQFLLRTFYIARLRENWVVAALVAVFAAILLRVLMLNDGTFVYTLDDPYIHLQFSTQLARGHFGLLPEEIASPSSSPLWPLLLAPFSFSAYHEFVPFLINVPATIASLLLWRHGLHRFVLGGDEKTRWNQASGLALIAVLTTNAAGLAFSGMEHPLQVAATLAALIGAIELIETGRIRWWLVAGVIAGPLLRYENIPVSATVLLVMLACGSWRQAVLTGAAIVAGLGGYALVALSAGLPPIPGSIQIKTLVGRNPSDPIFFLAELRSLLAHFVSYMLRGQWAGTAGLPLMSLLAARPFLRHEKLGWARRILLGGILVSALLQLVFGAHYNMGRHDCFSFNALLLGCAYFYRAGLRSALANMTAWRTFGIALLVMVPIMHGMTSALLLTPMASQDIYRQQWQMRRFLMTTADEGVAVHDVGLVSYRSGQRVFDLIGLGSEEIRRRQKLGDLDGPEVRAMIRKRNINAVLVPTFERRFDWEQVAVFDLGRTRVSTADTQIILYGIDAAAAARLRQKAIEFAPTMPQGSRLKIIRPPAGGS